MGGLPKEGGPRTRWYLGFENFHFWLSVCWSRVLDLGPDPPHPPPESGLHITSFSVKAIHLWQNLHLMNWWSSRESKFCFEFICRHNTQLSLLNAPLGPPPPPHPLPLGPAHASWTRRTRPGVNINYVLYIKMSINFVLTSSSYPTYLAPIRSYGTFWTPQIWQCVT